MRITFAGLLLLLSLQYLGAQDYFNRKENQNRKHLILVHPTRTNLERYSFLMQEGILDPGKNQLVGVYFETEKYDYSEVIRDFPNFGFHMVPGNLDPGNLYTENEASSEFKKIFNFSRGIIFNGGPDIPPDTYGEEMSILSVVEDPYRHYYELSFLFHLMGGPQNEEFEPFMKKRPKYAVLAICLGLQTLNVANGGSLVQDIPMEIYGLNTVEEILTTDPVLQHRNYYANYEIYPDIPSYFLHPIKIIPGRWLANDRLLAENPAPFVFSSHHQAIENPGRDLRIAATSMDGKIIEAMEHVRYPNVLGIQFHPEVDYLYRKDRKYRFSPAGELFSIREKLIETKSLEFHFQLWKLFSDAL